MSEPQNTQSQSPPAERAEVLVDQVGARLGHFLSVAGYQVRKATARAREEAEDIWAEAQAIRRGDHSSTR